MEFKDGLLRKKDTFIKDPSKWELTEPELARIRTLDLKEMSREGIHDVMFPKQNEVEEEKRVWIGFLNYKYEKSFNLLVGAQEKRYKEHFKRYDEKMRKLKHEEISAFQQFY